MSTNRRPFVLPPFSTVLLGVALAACSRGAADKPEANDTEDADAPVPVEVVPLERGPIEETLRFSATLEAETAVQVLARTTGQAISPYKLFAVRQVPDKYRFEFFVKVIVL